MFIPFQTCAAYLQKWMAKSSPVFIFFSCTCDELSAKKCLQMCIAQLSAQRLCDWLLTVIKWHFLCLPTLKVPLSEFHPTGHFCCPGLKGVHSWPLSLKVTLFFPFYPSYNQQFLDSVCKINNPLHETAQVGSIAFWVLFFGVFFFSAGEFCCIFIKRKKS